HGEGASDLPERDRKVETKRFGENHRQIKRKLAVPGLPGRLRACCHGMRPCGGSGRNGAREAKQRGIGRRLVPMVEGDVERPLVLDVPTTAQRMVDIHGSAAKPLAKPMLPNEAKAAMIRSRRPRRTIICVDRHSPGRLRCCAK